MFSKHPKPAGQPSKNNTFYFTKFEACRRFRNSVINIINGLNFVLIFLLKLPFLQLQLQSFHLLGVCLEHIMSILYWFDIAEYDFFAVLRELYVALKLPKVLDRLIEGRIVLDTIDSFGLKFHLNVFIKV